MVLGLFYCDRSRESCQFRLHNGHANLSDPPLSVHPRTKQEHATVFCFFPLLLCLRFLFLFLVLSCACQRCRNLKSQNLHMYFSSLSLVPTWLLSFLFEKPLQGITNFKSAIFHRVIGVENCFKMLRVIENAAA